MSNYNNNNNRINCVIKTLVEFCVSLRSCAPSEPSWCHHIWSAPQPHIRRRPLAPASEVTAVPSSWALVLFHHCWQWQWMWRRSVVVRLGPAVRGLLPRSPSQSWSVFRSVLVTPAAPWPCHRWHFSRAPCERQTATTTHRCTADDAWCPVHAFWSTFPLCCVAMPSMCWIHLIRTRWNRIVRRSVCGILYGANDANI